jgi:hypothetical protein
MPIARNAPMQTIESLESRQHFAVTASPGFPLTFGGGGFDAAQHVATDPSGNVIVAGLFSGTTNFNVQGGRKTLTARGDTDVFLAKYTAGGALLWVQQIGGDQTSKEMAEFKRRDILINPRRMGGFVGRVGDQPRRAGEYVEDMAVDSAGNIVLTGAFVKTIALGNLTLTADQTIDDEFYDALIAKFDTNGNLTWTRNVGGPFDDLAMSVSLDAAGNPYIGGYFTRLADFDPSSRVYQLTTVGRDAGFVMRLTSDGALAWVYQFDNESARIDQRNAVNDVVVTPRGNVYLVGTFSEDTDFDPSRKTYVLKSNGKTDSFLASLNRKGGLNWAVSVGGNGYDGNSAVALDSSGNIYTAGYFSKEIDVHVGTGLANLIEAQNPGGSNSDDFTDILVSKYAPNGLALWHAQMGGENFETVSDLQIGADGSVYTVGSFFGDADFAPGRSKVILSSAPVANEDSIDDGNTRDDREETYDFYVSRLSPRGKFVSAARFGGGDDDYASSLGFTSDGSLLLAGRATTARGDRDDRQEQSLVYLLDTDLKRLG